MHLNLGSNPVHATADRLLRAAVSDLAMLFTSVSHIMSGLKKLAMKQPRQAKGVRHVLRTFVHLRYTILLG